MPNKKPKISIIIPMYGVEKYLPRCLDSVLAQTFTDWQAVLVDDGSPDKSGEIAENGKNLWGIYRCFTVY